MSVSKNPSQRKCLTGEIQENIAVGLRVKPYDIGEKLCQIVDDRNIRIRKTNEVFTFDEVFNESSDSNEIFVKFLAPVIDRFTQGQNGSICAYGQTSSGKTFTMKGTNEKPGLIPLTLENIFNSIQNVSYVELYNETIFDLLTQNRTIIEIRENTQNKGVFLQDAKQELVTNYNQFMSLFYYGEEQRQFGETKMNENSSRSHVLLQLSLETRLRKPPFTTQVSQLCLVDLAGSEGVSKTSADGLRRKEGCLINKSLLALQNVVKQLKENKQNRYVNFRDSKLTRLLQNSLSGNSLTVFLLTISQVQENMQESLNTIRFGMAAGAIKNNIKVISEEESEDKAEYALQFQLLNDQKKVLEDEKYQAYLSIAVLQEQKSSMEGQMLQMSNQIDSLHKKVDELQERNQELSNQNQDISSKKQDLLMINEKISNHLMTYVQSAEQRGLYKQSLVSCEVQTDEQDQSHLKQISALQRECVELSEQLIKQQVQVVHKAKQIQAAQYQITPQKHKPQQDDKIEFQHGIMQQSLQKNQEYLQILSINSELQSELIQKSKESLFLKKLLDDRDKQCRSKDEQCFLLKQQLFDKQSTDKRALQSLENMSYRMKKKVVNSPSKDELKKSLLRQELKSQSFITEIERYQRTTSQIQKEKEILQNYSQKMFETMVANNIHLHGEV